MILNILLSAVTTLSMFGSTFATHLERVKPATVATWQYVDSWLCFFVMVFGIIATAVGYDVTVLRSPALTVDFSYTAGSSVSLVIVGFIFAGVCVLIQRQQMKISTKVAVIATGEDQSLLRGQV